MNTYLMLFTCLFGHFLGSLVYISDVYIISPLHHVTKWMSCYNTNVVTICWSVHCFDNIYIYIYIYLIHDTQSAQISHRQDGHNIHIGKMDTWFCVNHVPKCMSCYKAIVVITSREGTLFSWLHIYIYICNHENNGEIKLKYLYYYIYTIYL